MPAGRREGDDGDAGRVDVDGEVGEQLFDELELVVEVRGADARALVDQEHQLDLAVDRAAQRLDVSLQNRSEHVHLHRNRSITQHRCKNIQIKVKDVKNVKT